MRWWWSILGTEKMVWVVPTLAAAGFFAGTISFENTERRLEDDKEDEGTFELEGLDDDAGDS